MCGETNWVKNARAAGRVTLTRGRLSREYVVAEVPLGERVPVLRSSLKTEPMGRRQIALDADAAEEDLRRAATQIPVLRAALTEPDDLRDGPNT